MRLEIRNINYVKSISLEVRGKVLYQFLHIGISMREIGKNISDTVEIDGWQAWAIIHFYGFDKNHKGAYQQLTLKKLMKGLVNLSEKEIEEFHLSPETLEEVILAYHLNLAESDGADIFRNIKIKIEQYKLREQLLDNYHHKCAFCKISSPKLLMNHHIKSWAKATKEERVDPQNSIILCSLHDALFENGLLSLSDQYEVVFSSDLDCTEQGISMDIRFCQPQRHPPGLRFLKEHRERFNLVISQGRIF